MRSINKIPRTCRVCGAPFDVFPSEIKKGGGLYCRPECYRATKAARVERSCDECGVIRMIPPSGIKPSGLSFCNRACADPYMGRRRRKSREEKYRQYVAEQAGCWGWSGPVDDKGYGRFTITVGYKRKKHVYAHHVAWETVNGAIPNGMVICHHCDNPPCTNPDHLFVGTPVDNAMDMVAKGRNPFGSRHGMSKLTESDVRIIRHWWSHGLATQPELARIFNVRQSNISAIVLRITWKHLP